MADQQLLNPTPPSTPETLAEEMDFVEVGPKILLPVRPKNPPALVGMCFFPAFIALRSSDRSYVPTKALPYFEGNRAFFVYSPGTVPTAETFKLHFGGSSGEIYDGFIETDDDNIWQVTHLDSSVTRLPEKIYSTRQYTFTCENPAIAPWIVFDSTCVAVLEPPAKKPNLTPVSNVPYASSVPALHAVKPQPAARPKIRLNQLESKLLLTVLGAYLTRDQISAMLAIGNIELHPGPVHKADKREKRIVNTVRKEAKKEVKKAVQKAKPRMAPKPRKARKPKHSKTAGIDLPTLIAMSFADPSGEHFVRYSDPYADEKTAITSPWERVPIIFDTTLESDSNSFFQFRDLSRAVIVESKTTGGVYNWLFTNQAQQITSALAKFTGIVTDGTPAAWQGSMAIPFAYALPSSNRVHGEALFAGTVSGLQEENERYIWLDTGATFSAVVNNPQATETGWTTAWSVKRLRNGVPEQILLLSAGSSEAIENADLTFIAPINGYHSIELVFLSSAGWDVDTSYITVGECEVSIPAARTFRHLPINGIFSVMSAIGSWRLSGTCMLYKQYAAPDDRAGSITGVQLHPANDWLSTTSGLTPIEGMQGSKEISALNGAHIFYKPTSEDIFDLKVFWRLNSSGQAYDSYYPIVPHDDFLAMKFTSPTPGSRNGKIEYHFAIEFTTTSVIWPTAVSEVESTVYSNGLSKLKRMENFHENPTHVRRLIAEASRRAPQALSRVMKTVNHGRDFAKDVMSIGSMVSKMVV